MSLSADPEPMHHALHAPSEDLHEEVRRLRRAILDASTEEDAETYRRLLDDVETRIEDHEVRCGCEGFPQGK